MNTTGSLPDQIWADRSVLLMVVLITNSTLMKIVEHVAVHFIKSNQMFYDM